MNSANPPCLVNGIRNPFGYQPWRDKRTFEAMFDILEADIVVLQECKIQRKDLRDDMVLVPGWDVYFSLPKHKKGYSGVAIYTRNSSCAPIRAEEGITGILTGPNSSVSYYDLPTAEQIGGYPDASQISGPLDAATLDSEGRCVIVEFSAFVLIGVYSPATRDESRDDFRLGFLNALDARIRNLVALGKRVFLTGDLNVIREELDMANAEEQLRKKGTTEEEYFSAPARRLFNHMLVDGKVVGDRDAGREQPVLWDICRSFHPSRRGMFTCWETKVNARPGNYGARIDYVLCSPDWKDWFCESNIQEGLMGSDHCPVYAIIKDKVEIDGQEVYLTDLVNQPGMYEGGKRLRDWSQKDLLPLSGKLLPEFDRRRSIRDMFVKKPSLPAGESSSGSTIYDSIDIATTTQQTETKKLQIDKAEAAIQGSLALSPVKLQRDISSTSSTTAKRSGDSLASPRSLKRAGSSISKKPAASKGQPPASQSTLKGFFKPKVAAADIVNATDESKHTSTVPKTTSETIVSEPADKEPGRPEFAISHDESGSNAETPLKPFNIHDQKNVIDPIVAKESWGKLLSKRVVPKCEHDEPCISFLTKKPGVNCGRSFYMCSRPLGPSGQKEKNSQWRCGTFIWSSDWTGDVG